MKLGPFVTSKAGIGAQSAAAGQDVQLALATGRTKMHNAQTIGNLGDSMLSKGMAADLAKGRTEVALAASNATAAIEQNPDYMPVEQAEEFGVQIDETKLVEGSDGQMMVRTYEIADELYTNAVKTSAESAGKRWSMPAVSNALTEEVKVKYETEGRNRLNTWSVGKKRELQQTEYRADMDSLRENGAFDAAHANTDALVADGVISAAEGVKQRQLTNVTEEVRDTDKAIMAAQNDPAALPEMKARLAEYEEHIKDETSIVFGMTPSKMYSERNRMYAAIAALENANVTKAKVSVAEDKRQLRAIRDGAGSGRNNLGQDGVDMYQAKLERMEASGDFTPTQLDEYRFLVQEAGVMSGNEDLFADIASGSKEKAQTAYDTAMVQSQNFDPTMATEAGLLARAAQTAMDDRNQQLENNPAPYIRENDTAVQQSYVALRNDPENTALLSVYIDAQVEAQKRFGVPDSKIRVFGPNDSIVTEMQNGLLSGNWPKTVATLERLNEMDPAHYSAIAKSISGEGKEANMAQMVMQTYQDDPVVSERIARGYGLKDSVPVDETALHTGILANLAGTMDPATVNAMMPSLDAYYRSVLASGQNEDYAEDPTPAAINDLVTNVLGPQVTFKQSLYERGMSVRSDLSLYKRSKPTRSYRDASKQWVPGETTRRKIDAITRAETKMFHVGAGRQLSLSKIAERADLVFIGNGQYRVDVHVGGGKTVPLQQNGLQSGGLYVIDLTVGQ